MPCGTSTAEKVVALAIVFRFGDHIGISIAAAIEVVTIGVAAAFVDTTVESDVGVGIEQTAAVIDVCARSTTAQVVEVELNATVVAGLAIAFEDDVDDTGRTFGAIFARRIGDDLDAVDAFGGHLFEDVAAIVGGESLRLTVDPDGDACRTAERYCAFAIDFDRWDSLESFACRKTGSRCLRTDVEYLLIDFETHRRLLTNHIHFIENLGVVIHLEGRKTNEGIVGLGIDSDVLLDGLVTYITDFQFVVAVLDIGQFEMTGLIDNTTRYQFSTGIEQRDINKLERDIF